MQKLLKANNIEDFLQSRYDDVIMLGIRDECITIMTTSKSQEYTAAVLELATDESLRELFPHLRDGYVH